jgi:hypothetical protein
VPSGPTNSGKGVAGGGEHLALAFTSRASAPVGMLPARRGDMLLDGQLDAVGPAPPHLALRTQGSFSKAARTASRFTVKKLPATALRAAYSICVGVTSRSGLATTTSRSGKKGRRATASVAA